MGAATPQAALGLRARARSHSGGVASGPHPLPVPGLSVGMQLTKQLASPRVDGQRLRTGIWTPLPPSLGTGSMTAAWGLRGQACGPPSQKPPLLAMLQGSCDQGHKPSEDACPPAAQSRWAR